MFQDGVAAAYRPRRIRADIKSTARITLYRDAFTAFDSLADIHMDGKGLHAGWLTYETQRHLQFTKALLVPEGMAGIRFVVQLDHIDSFELIFAAEFGNAYYTAKYSGSRGPVERAISLNDIHDYASAKRNIVMPVVRDIRTKSAEYLAYPKLPLVFGIAMAT